MKLIGRNLSPFTRRVAVALNVMGIPHERDRLSPWTAEEAAKIRAQNPLTRVPILVLDDGEQLIESGAILDHVMETAGPQKALIPASGKARRDCLRIAAFATGVMDKGVAAFYERTKRPAEKVHKDWHDHLASQVTGGLKMLESLPMTPYFAGAKMSVADISAAVAVTFIKRTNPDLFSDAAYPKLAALTAKCEAMPEFKSSPLE